VSKSTGDPVILTTDRMSPGALRDLYEADDHAGSYVYLIGHMPAVYQRPGLFGWGAVAQVSPPTMLYASFNYNGPQDFDDHGVLRVPPQSREAMRSCVSRVHDIVAEFQEVYV
jgi:hypothetical protein